MYRYNKRTLLRRCGISYREIFRHCKDTKIFVSAQGFKQYKMLINKKAPHKGGANRIVVFF